jgi:hypothetical protein
MLLEKDHISFTHTIHPPVKGRVKISASVLFLSNQYNVSHIEFSKDTFFGLAPISLLIAQLNNLVAQPVGHQAPDD